MVVASALIIMLVLPITRVARVSLSGATANGARQDAAELASSVLAKLAALPYGEVGFTAGTLAATVDAVPGYATRGDDSTYLWQGSTLVVLAPGTSDPSFTLGSNAVAFAPTMTGVLAGAAPFAVTTHVVEESARVPTCPGAESPTTTLADAYVHAFVTVTWMSLGVRQALSLDTLIYPGGLGTYSGPSYQASLVPGTPAAVTAAPAAVTGEVTVSWTVPSSWTYPSCFSVGWFDAGQQSSSSGLIPDSDLIGIAPGATVSYTVANLTQAAEYDFDVTAYAADGVESTESTDSGTVQSPTGPLVASVTTSPGGAPGPAAYGPPSGGTAVTITGQGFSTSPGGTAVKLGSAPATSVSCSSTTTCTAVAPAGSGTVDVTAQTLTGAGGTAVSSPTLVGDRYSYEPVVASLSPTSGPAAGGTSLTVTGVNFVTGATSMTFGATGGTRVGATCSSSTSCTVTAPPETAAQQVTGAPVDVIATTAGGSSAVSNGDQFTYLPRPVVDAVSPSSGPAAGGTTVSVSGSGFVVGATTFAFGAGNSAPGRCTSATSCTATSPAETGPDHASGGLVDVLATTAGGTSAQQTGDQFQYS